ncbi:hypothetical protein FRC08_017687 [Ceratobasidium sp. 394]|nr:hypothetical protein FRC08_017687 [Ceratobasidium sp. 394]
MAIDCPEDLEELEHLVWEAKESGKHGFHKLPADGQDVLLDALPGDIAAMLKTWERKTNTRIYIMSNECTRIQAKWNRFIFQESSMATLE